MRGGGGGAGGGRKEGDEDDVCDRRWGAAQLGARRGVSAFQPTETCFVQAKRRAAWLAGCRTQWSRRGRASAVCVFFLGVLCCALYACVVMGVAN